MFLSFCLDWNIEYSCVPCQDLAKTLWLYAFCYGKALQDRQVSKKNLTEKRKMTWQNLLRTCLISGKMFILGFLVELWQKRSSWLLSRISFETCLSEHGWRCMILPESTTAPAIESTMSSSMPSSSIQTSKPAVMRIFFRILALGFVPQL